MSILNRFSASSALLLALLCGAAPALAQDGPYGYAGNGGAATNTETRLAAVEDQIRMLTGKVEQVDFILRRMDQAIQRMQSDYDARLTKLESTPPQVTVQQPASVAPPVGQPQAGAPVVHTAEESPVEPASVTGTLGGIKVRGEKVTGAVVNPKAPPLPEKPADYGLTAQEQYDRAFALLRQANYEEAEKAFKGFIDKHGQDKLIDNAKYWYAETFYVRGKFSDSAVAFADAYQQNPKGTKAPDTLLKLAMTLAALEKTQDSCGTLDALKAKYPTAPATIRSRADQERARLKCK